MKNLVGRLAGKESRPPEPSPATSGHGQPPRQEPSHKSAVEVRQVEQERGLAEGKSRGRKRRGGRSQPVAPAWTPDEFQVAPKEGETRFHDLGFHYCSPIQASILPHTLQGHDAIGKAQTGTGKTAAFLITIFNDLLCNPVEGERFVGEPRALVIAPTRELVMQIAADAEDLGKYTGLQVAIRMLKT